MDLPALEKDLGVGLPADYLDRIMFHPTLTIRGLHSGFLGKEANTIIPHRATVLLDMRMVKNQRWEKVYRRILEHIRGQGFTVHRVARRAPARRAARPRRARRLEGRLRSGQDVAGPAREPGDHRGRGARARRRARGADAHPRRQRADLRVHRHPQLPTLLVPYANANNRQHSPNEHLRLDHLFQGVRTTAQLLTDLA